MTWRTAKRYSRAGGTFSATDSSSNPQTGSTPGTQSMPSPQAPGPGIPSAPAPQAPGIPSGPVPSGPGPGPNFPGSGSWGSSSVYHPPGPGIGISSKPAPALGRPGDLRGDHGAWKNDGCFSQGSKGWKPDIMSLGDAHSCPGERGPQSPDRPSNISEGQGGYNSHAFREESDVAEALQYLGYFGTDGEAMLRRFQKHWNLVSSRISYVPDRYREIFSLHIPRGILSADGRIGPDTLNAIEIAAVNQRTSPQLAWSNVIDMVTTSGNGYGKKNLYNAAQGM